MKINIVGSLPNFLFIFHMDNGPLGIIDFMCIDVSANAFIPNL